MSIRPYPKLLRAIAKSIPGDMRGKIECTSCESLKPVSRNVNQAITREAER
jgi:hypothetical protein